MRIGQLKKYIIKHYFSQRRTERKYGLLILGAPGVGKSTSVEEAAREIAKRMKKEFLKIVLRWHPKLNKFVINTEGEHEIEEVLVNAENYFVFTDFRLSNVEPTDLSGIPRSHKMMTFYEPLFWATIHSAAPGIVFLDELTWVQREDTWAIAPQIVLDKVAGFVKFHRDTMVIAAGNRPEDASSIVRLIHNPLLNRFKIIKVSPPTVQEWAEYMNNKHGDAWDKKVYAFLMRFRDEGYLLKLPKGVVPR